MAVSVDEKIISAFHEGFYHGVASEHDGPDYSQAWLDSETRRQALEEDDGGEKP